MKILVLGGNGMLGHRCARLLSLRHDVTATLRRPDEVAQRSAPDAAFLSGVSVEEPTSALEVIERIRPDAVVNCIGVTKQRDEAHDAVTSIRANSLFPHTIAQACERAGARFVHVSTDCVFTGAKGMYLEADTPDATDLYGRTKLLGEVTGVSGAVTVRTSMIGWEIRDGRSLLEWFARQRGGTCAGFTHAVFSGLATSDLAGVIERLCTDWRDVDGLWHVSTDPIDKYALLTGLREALGWDIAIEPVGEPRIDRSLDSTAFRRRTGWHPRPWPDAMQTIADERPLYELIRGESAERVVSEA